MDNVTTVVAPPPQVPVFGWPGYLFYLIHITALVLLSISLLTSVGVLIYALPPIRTFFSRPIGERLVIYLSFCDLLHHTSHILDHSYMAAVKNHPPKAICAVFAFFLNEFTLSQALTVVFAAVNAFSMVVCSKQLDTGRYDWRFLLFIYGLPSVSGILGLATNYFGPSGAWCHIDMTKEHAPIAANLLSIFLIVVFVFNVVCYVGIAIRIRQVARTNTGGQKYGRTIRVMMVFILVYILQWWALATFNTWALIGRPHVVILVATISFSNLGGIFNFLAYTIIRKKYQKVNNSATSTGQSTGVTT